MVWRQNGCAKEASLHQAAGGLCYARPRRR